MKYQRQNSVAGGGNDNFVTNQLQGLVIVKVGFFVAGAGFTLNIVPLFQGLGPNEDGSLSIDGSWEENFRDKVQSQLEFKITNDDGVNAQEYTLIIDAHRPEDVTETLLQEVVKELQLLNGQTTTMKDYLKLLEKR